MSRPLKNWLLLVPPTPTTPPLIPPPSTSIGNRPSSPAYPTLAPKPFMASTRSSTGRSRIRATPSTRYGPSPSANTGGKNLAAVPAFPTNTSTPLLGIMPLDDYGTGPAVGFRGKTEPGKGGHEPVGVVGE